MKKLLHLFFFLFLANLTQQTNAQTVNNATVNIQGAGQNVTITQSGAGHSANLQLVGDGIAVNVSQTGTTPQSFSLNITCYSSCSPAQHNVNQY